MILVVHTMSLNNPSDATLLSLSISIYLRCRPKWRPIISENSVWYDKNLSNSFFFLKLLAMKFESDWRHLALNQIKNKIRMWTAWPPRLQFITTNVRKSSLRLANSRNLHSKCSFYWFLNYKHYRDAIHASFRIWYIQDGVQDNSQQVLQARGSSTLPVGMSDGFVTDQTPYQIDQHFTSSCIYSQGLLVSDTKIFCTFSLYKPT